MAYELKTLKNKASITSYIKSIEDDERRKDAKIVHKMMQEITKDKGSMWGKTIAGYGNYSYKGSDKVERQWMATGWSFRKQSLTLYIMPGYNFADMKEALRKLGPHKTGRSCLYIKRLSDIHMPTLKKIVRNGYKELMRRQKNT